MKVDLDDLARKLPALAEARAIPARHVPVDRDLVSELIADRRRQAAREEKRS